MSAGSVRRMPRIRPSVSVGGERVVVERMPRYRTTTPAPEGERIKLERMPRVRPSKAPVMNRPAEAGAPPPTAPIDQLRTLIGLAVRLGEDNGYVRYTAKRDIAQVKQHLAEHRLAPLRLDHHPEFTAYADAESKAVILLRGKDYFVIPPGTIPAELFAAPGLKA